MQCLYCGNRISLLRKFKDSEFCSEQHRNLYGQEQTDLALARLTETGNRINQPRRPAEPVEVFEDKQVAATPEEEFNLPALLGFIPEPLAGPQLAPLHRSGIGTEWLSVIAMPPLVGASKAKVTWEPRGYCRPALASRSGAEIPLAGGRVPQAEFKRIKPQLPVTDLALDLDEQVSQEAPEHYAVAPPVPIPMPSPARPEEMSPLSPEAAIFEAWPPALVSNLKLLPVQPSTAGLGVLQLCAASPHAEWTAPRMWYAVPRVSVETLTDGPFQPSGATRILSEPGWGDQVSSLAAYLPQPLSARSSDARAPEAGGAVAGTPPRRLPASVCLPGAKLRLALCQTPKPGAAARTTSVLAAGVAFAASAQDAVRWPALLAPSIAMGMPPAAYIPQPLAACSSDARSPKAADAFAGTPLRLLPASAGLPDAELRLQLCRLPKPGAAAGTNSVLATGMALATSTQDPIHLPGFLGPAIAVGMARLSGCVSMPLAAAGPLDISTEAAGEIPLAVTHRWPKLAWSAATPRLRAEAALSTLEIATHSLPPRTVAGADQVEPLASLAQGAQDVAAATWLPTAHLPGPRLSRAESLVRLAEPLWTAGAQATLAAPLPEVHTFIPSRRRPELKARIALPSVGRFVRCRGMATSVNLQRLGAHLASVEDPRLTASGAVRSMDWIPFPSPAMPSPNAILGLRILTVTPASVRPLVRLFSIDLTNLTSAVPPAKPIGVNAPHTVCRPPRLPSMGSAQDGIQTHERTSKLLRAMMERLEGGTTRWAFTRLWRRAPLPLKGLMAGIVLLSVLTAIGSQSSGIQLSGLREDIRSRAAVDLVDDFRAGMGAWGGAENWAETWSYDDAGFAQTGDLALYRPSMRLNDYQFEFLGQIARRGMGWVFRAVDTRNYYAMKIVFAKSGPMPAGIIVRYAVIDGKPGPKTQLPLPMGARPDTMYRIRVDADGSYFTAKFQDQIVDVWSDSRLAAGGVGFFSDKGEQAKIRWIEVTHQSDFLGKLCAYLVPFDTRSANRSMTQ